jgi:hypothetical protein
MYISQDVDKYATLKRHAFIFLQGQINDITIMLSTPPHRSSSAGGFGVQKR